MSLDDLIQELEDARDNGMPGDTEVMFAYQYGDYWKTVVVEEIQTMDEQVVEYSSYHQRYKVPDEDRVQEILKENPGLAPGINYDRKKEPKVILMIQ